MEVQIYGRLTEEQKEDVKEACAEYNEALPERPSRTTLETCEVEPVQSKEYPILSAMREITTQEFK